MFESRSFFCHTMIRKLANKQNTNKLQTQEKYRTQSCRAINGQHSKVGQRSRSQGQLIATGQYLWLRVYELKTNNTKKSNFTDLINRKRNLRCYFKVKRAKVKVTRFYKSQARNEPYLMSRWFYGLQRTSKTRRLQSKRRSQNQFKSQDRITHAETENVLKTSERNVFWTSKITKKL